MTAAKATVAGYEIAVPPIKPGAKWSLLTLKPVGSKPLPVGIETRVLESLRFVTFSPLEWSIAQKCEAGSREVTLQPTRIKGRPFLKPPLKHQGLMAGRDFWAMFGAYLEHVQQCNDKDHYHPLSIQLHPLIHWDGQDLATLALLLGVAVEGVLGAEFSNVARPTEQYREAVDKAEKAIKELSIEPENLSIRILGSLGQMKSSRAQDKLIRFKDAKVIEPKMLKAWKDLRNSAAHASFKPGSQEIDQLYNQCLTVQTLLNILVFSAINYAGHYFDFSKHKEASGRFTTPDAS